MSAKLLLALVCVAELSWLIQAGGGGGGHKKVIIHVPLYVKHHHHKHTIVKHVHHHPKDSGGGDDHYEVLGYTYGEPKSAHHFGGGKGWHAAEETGTGEESPVSFEGNSGYDVSGAGAEYSEGMSEGLGGY